MISERDKQELKKVLDQFVELGKEFSPQVTELVGLYFGAVTGSKEFEQLVKVNVATQLAKAMLSGSDATRSSEYVAQRALDIATLIQEGTKE